MSTCLARWCVFLSLATLSLLLGHERPAFSQEIHQPLPLRRVVLFSSSVGFYEHAGEVDGNKQIEISFKTEDINDLVFKFVPEGQVIVPYKAPKKEGGGAGDAARCSAAYPPTTAWA